MKSPAHDCPDCTHTTDVCPDCGRVVDAKYGLEHMSTYGWLDEWCPRHPIVIAVKADEKKRGVFDPAEWSG